MTNDPLLSMPTLVADGLRIRPFTLADLDLVAGAASDPYITAITTVPREFTVESGTAFIERQWGRALSGEGRSWAIARPEGDIAVGQIGLWPEAAREGSGQLASIGYWIAPSARGLGAAGRALRTVTAFAHQDGVDRCELYIEPWNEPSKRTARTAGYRTSGVDNRMLAGELRPTERFIHVLGDRSGAER